MRHHGAGVIDTQEQERAEAVELARELHDELDGINDAVRRSVWHPIDEGAGRAKRILVSEDVVKRIEALLSKAFSWRTKL
jgi:signal transduction histidine kinase